MPRRKNTRPSDAAAAPQRGPVPAFALPSATTHLTWPAVSALHDMVGDIVIEIRAPASSSAVHAWFRGTPDRLLYMMACADCGARTGVRLYEGPFDDASRRNSFLLQAWYEHILPFTDAHTACAATAGQALPAWPESTCSVPAVLPEAVAYWVDDVLHEAMTEDHPSDVSSLAGSRNVLVRFADGALDWARRDLVLTGPGAEAEIRGWWHEHLHTAVADAGGELLAVVTVVHNVPAAPIPGGERITSWAEVVTPAAAFGVPLARPSDPTVQYADLEFPWQPLLNPNPSIDGLFAVTVV